MFALSFILPCLDPSIQGGYHLHPTSVQANPSTPQAAAGSLVPVAATAPATSLRLPLHPPTETATVTNALLPRLQRASGPASPLNRRYLRPAPNGEPGAILPTSLKQITELSPSPIAHRLHLHLLPRARRRNHVLPRRSRETIPSGDASWEFSNNDVDTAVLQRERQHHRPVDAEQRPCLRL